MSAKPNDTKQTDLTGEQIDPTETTERLHRHSLALYEVGRDHPDLDARDQLRLAYERLVEQGWME